MELTQRGVRGEKGEEGRRRDGSKLLLSFPLHWYHIDMSMVKTNCFTCILGLIMRSGILKTHGVTRITTKTQW
eukprot:3426301-Pyramimonas_sp.AAC.1